MAWYKACMEHSKMVLEDKLFTVKFTPDTSSHLRPDNEMCKVCTNRVCTIVCPANVYEWDEAAQKLIVNFENCLECGACRIACIKQSLIWEYPKGTKGVTFKLG